MLRHLLLSLIGTIALVHLAHGLFEDQVGKFDWRLQFVGRTKHILRPSTNLWQDHQSLIVSTRSNVLAGLHLRNGSIHWRHPFESSDSSPNEIDFISSTFENVRGFKCPILSISGQGRYIRCWTPEGLLLTEQNLPTEFLNELSKQSQSDYLFLYDTVIHPTTSEPQLIFIKITYSAYLIEFFSYGLKSSSFESLGRYQAGRWLSSKTSCSLIGRSVTTKNLVCVSIDGLDLYVLPVELKASQSSAQKQFKRIPLSTFGLKSEQAPKFLSVEQLAYQSVEGSGDHTTTISKQKATDSLFAINLGGEGYLLLSLSPNPVDPKIELVKILPDAIKLTIIPLVSSNVESSSGDSNLIGFGLAVLFAKENALKYEEPEDGKNQERVFATKLVIFHLQKWTQIASMSAEQILLEFGSKNAISPIVSNGKLVKRVDSKWAIDQFEIIPIRIMSSNTRTGRNLYRYTYKMVLSTSDGTLIVLNLSGRINWSREESLAEIVSSVFLDLPLSENDASLEQEYSYDSNKNILWLFVNRVSSQLSQLSALLRHIQHWISHPKSHHRPSSVRDQERELDGNVESLELDDSDVEEDEDEDELLVRDYFGLHKIILLRTKVGKLLALDSLTGKVIWSKYVPSLRLNSNEAKFPIYVQRTSAHFPFSALCTFLTESADNPQESILYSFDPFTGKSVNSQTLPYPITQAMMVHTIHDAEFRRPILYLDSSLKGHLYPDSAETRELFVKHASSNYYMLIANQTSFQVAGYSFAKSDAVTGPVAEQVWSFNLPQVGTSQITDLMAVFKRPNEHVHSQGRVLGDRNVLYKYLNPNLVAIVWESLDTQDKPSITLYLIDAVTGNIAYSIVHRRARGPIQIVHSENWVIYSYFNEKMRRNEISSVELYEGFEQINATAFSSIGRDLIFMPLPEQQTFIFPTGIGIITDTETQKGITNKHLLISLPTGGLLELPRAFLDPRRPIKPTQEHAEEGLIPYVPELPIPSEALINYNQTILGVRGIQTGPTSLESTSLVFAYGLDIFYTRVTPSKTFDVLKDDFDFLLIAAVLLALLAFSYLSKMLAARKSLNAAWK